MGFCPLAETHFLNDAKVPIQNIDVGGFVRRPLDPTKALSTWFALPLHKIESVLILNGTKVPIQNKCEFYCFTL